MKILHATYIYPPQPKVADGITNAVYNVTKELARRGHEVVVYTSNLLNLHDSITLNPGHYIINGVDIFYFRSLLRYKTFIFTPSIIKYLFKDGTNFDVIHIHDARSFQGIMAFLMGSAKSIPWVFQPHGSYLLSSQERYGVGIVEIIKKILDKLISNRICRGAAKIIALSKAEAEKYRALGLSEEKITIIPNGIDMSKYANLPPKGLFKKKLGIPEDMKVILYLGRVHRSKGIDLLIRAHEYLIKKRGLKDAVLVIAGPDDGYLSEARSLAMSLNVSASILFTGFIGEEDKLAALADAEVFVTPSFYGFPVTFLEACAAGVPIVTTTRGDVLEWIDGNVGFVTQPSPQDLAEHIYSIVSNEAMRREFSKNCVKTAHDFSIERIVSKLEETYQEIARA